MTDETKPELTPAQLRDIQRLNEETEARQAMHDRWKAEEAKREEADRATPLKTEE